MLCAYALSAPAVKLTNNHAPMESYFDRPSPLSRRRFVTVLSIDGGGVRGIIPGKMLDCLESHLQAIDGEEARIADYFDVIAGTSTGGLVTTMLTAPDKSNRPIYAAKDIIGFYLTHLSNIFPQKSKICTIYDEISGPKYDGKYLHDLVKGILGETKLHQALTNILIPTFDIRLFRPTIFSSFEAKTTALKDAYLSDVCIGTSAAPTFLPAHYFQTKDSNGKTRSFNLIDGGVAANNPTLLAVKMASKHIFQGRPVSLAVKPFEYTKFLVLSLGTGSTKEEESYSATEVAKWGSLRWLYSNGRTPLLDISLTANTEMDDIMTSIVFQILGSKENYIRIQDDSLPASASAMDNSTAENLRELVKIGENLLQKPLSRLNINTGKYEPVGGGTNEEALIKLASMLAEEKKKRINDAKMAIAV